MADIEITSWMSRADRLDRARQLAAESERRLAGFVDPPISLLADLATLHLAIAQEEDRQAEVENKQRTDQILRDNIAKARQDRPTGPERIPGY